MSNKRRNRQIKELDCLKVQYRDLYNKLKAFRGEDFLTNDKYSSVNLQNVYGWGIEKLGELGALVKDRRDILSLIESYAHYSNYMLGLEQSKDKPYFDLRSAREFRVKNRPK